MMQFPLLVAVVVTAGVTSASPPRTVDSIAGSWTAFIGDALPNLQLPHVPLLGNGLLGVAMGSHGNTTTSGPAASSSGPGPGSPSSLDLWINSNSFWSCTSDCGGADPDHDVAGCCSAAALGGVSFRLGPSLAAAGSSPLASFAATQAIAEGALTATFTTAAGGVLSACVIIHPRNSTVVTNLTWTPGRPGGGDPQTLVVDVATWVLGDGHLPGSWSDATPAPASVGCALGSGRPGTWVPGGQSACAPWADGTHGAAVTAAAAAAAAAGGGGGGGTGGGGGGTGGGGAPAFAVYASRNSSTVATPYRLAVAALSTGLLLGGSAAVLGTNVTSHTPGRPPSAPWEAVIRLSLPGAPSSSSASSSSSSSSWAAAVTTVSASFGNPGDAWAADPTPAALAALSDVLAGPDPLAIRADADAWWLSFWNASSVSLPSRPTLEAMWYGAQYILAASSSTTSDVDVAAPGLYGPWVTADAPNWHGDYTLDYNYAAPYYGTFGSNHPQSAEAYWRPVLDWMPAARIKAQRQAGYAGITCPTNALYYACHIAPAGLMSLDGMERYMTWNGPHAVLLFVNHFEYTRNATFAASTILPLLDGLNAWWACYLNRTVTGPGPDDYVYEDNNAANPDYEHEGQPVPNPQIAIALLRRTVGAQLDISAQLGIAPPAALVDIYAHLSPLNTAAVNRSTWSNFTVENDTRCEYDFMTNYDVASYGACEALCAAADGCAAFSYCPPAPLDGCTGTNGQPKPRTCWGFQADVVPYCATNATRNLGWVSGYRNATSTGETVAFWTAYERAARAESDWFAAYPVWPSEAVEPFAPGGGRDVGGTGGPPLAGIAQATMTTYASFATGRPVDLFPMAVRSSFNTSSDASFTPKQVLDGLDAYLAGFWGPNLLPYAPGGGIENTGVTRAVNEMLLQAARFQGPASSTFPPPSNGAAYLLSLFSFWPSDEPASFATLLSKGGFLVSASYDNVTASVGDVIGVQAAYALPSVTLSPCALLNPWGGGLVPPARVAVTCAGAAAAVPSKWEMAGLNAGLMLVFDLPVGVPCQVVRSPGAL